MKAYLENERKIILESIKKNGNSEHREKRLRYIDIMRGDKHLLSVVDHHVKEMYFLEMHLWIIDMAYTESLDFIELGIEEKHYNRSYKKPKEKAFNEIKPLLDRNAKLRLQKPPNEIIKEFYTTLRDLDYPEKTIKRIMSTLPINKKNKPTGFKERPENVSVFGFVYRIEQ